MPREDVLIVDGYNVINSWPELIKLKDENFEHARLRLIERLSNYSGYRGIKIIVVFDAHQVKGGIERREYHDNIQIIFSAEGVLADLVIEKLISSFPRDTKVFVATSDKIEQEVIWGKGAYRMSSRELLGEVQKAAQCSASFLQEKQHRPYCLDSHLSCETIEILEKWRRGKK